MKRYLSSILIVFTLLSMCAVCAGYYLMARTSETQSSVPSPSPVAGHVSFLSSGQVRVKSNQGIDDEVQVDLAHIPNPAMHNSYYAWLRSAKDQADPLSLLLGVLVVQEGTAHLFYPGSLQHTNLLKIMGRLLVTEEDSTLTPVSPSPDVTTWHYSADFAQMLSPSSDTLGSTNKGGTHGRSTQSFPIYRLQKGA